MELGVARRLGTFHIKTWHGNTIDINPVECAKLGYINAAENELLCEECGVRIINPDSWYQIMESHAKGCKMRRFEMFDYEKILAFQEEEFIRRVESFREWQLFPILNFSVFGEADNEIWSRFFKEFPIIEIDKALALFGFSAKDTEISCKLCGIKTKLPEYTIKVGKVINSSSQRDSIGINQQFDLVKAHRFYCPFINDLTVSDLSYLSTAPKSLNFGWRFLLSKLTSNRPNIDFILSSTAKNLEAHRSLLNSFW
ncbi:unnamed protein product [Blepharisma stoltei]|uniref:Uncharacterized protein n=1 Tax=Blepharisma stoltei TaxID=1481888 RepID=A0AAU9J3P0_9CILI|nr:unnamed protein product [Blepharisma stoltei]